MKEMQTTHTFQTRSLGSALGIWRDKKGSFEVRRQTPEHVVFIDSTPQQSQDDKKNKTLLTDRSARVWVPIIVKIEPRNDCTRDHLHCDLNNILQQHYTSRTQNSENASSICLHMFHPSTSILPVRQSSSLSKCLFMIDPTATKILNLS